MEQIQNIITSLLIVFIPFCIGVITVIMLLKGNDELSEYKAKDIKEKTKNELEKKSAADIIADSDNHDVISSNIEKEQQKLRERVRNRLKKDLLRNGSSSDN